VYGNTVSGACASLHPGHVCVVSQHQSVCVPTRSGRDMALLIKCSSAAVDMLKEQKDMLLVSAYELLAPEDTCR
jgi:hypothetical protein